MANDARVLSEHEEAMALLPAATRILLGYLPEWPIEHRYVMLEAEPNIRILVQRILSCRFAVGGF